MIGLLSGAWTLLKRIPWQVPFGLAAAIVLWILVGRLETAFHDWKQGVYDSGVKAENLRWQTAQAEATKRNLQTVVSTERQTGAVSAENNHDLQADAASRDARYRVLREQPIIALPDHPDCSATPGFPDIAGCTYDPATRQRLLGLAEDADADADQLRRAIKWAADQQALDAKLTAEGQLPDKQ